MDGQAPYGEPAFDFWICEMEERAMKKLAARAEIFERGEGKTLGFGIIWVGWVGKDRAAQSGMLYRTKERALELATECCASSVTDIGPLPLPEA